MMEINRTKLGRRIYVCPMVENIYVEEESMMEFSGDHEHIGQGDGDYGDAKRGFFSDDDEEQPQRINAWED
ncbi:hypothetical protein [Hallella seregens]|uniref:Uncharacterized protein n=1 Tax=Hallella seregens ATCC 51272 TaxID=1336250 RepID=A0ABV5ZIF9_9BACT|nr:hypothetical protein [Hallella seregens]